MGFPLVLIIFNSQRRDRLRSLSFSEGVSRKDRSVPSTMTRSSMGAALLLLSGLPLSAMGQSVPFLETLKASKQVSPQCVAGELSNWLQVPCPYLCHGK